MKRAVISLALISGVAFATGYGWRYWTVGQYLESTDDAYVKADYTTIAPKVSGYIVDVLGAGQPAGHGRASARAYRRPRLPHRARTGQSRGRSRRGSDPKPRCSDRAAAFGDRAGAGRHRRGRSDIEIRRRGSRPLPGPDELRLRFGATRAGGRRCPARADRLSCSGRAPGWSRRRSRIEVLATERGKAEAERDAQPRTLHQAELNLSYATITAPVYGTVGARSLRVGQYRAGGHSADGGGTACTPLTWSANFKETQLADVRGGEAVSHHGRRTAPASSIHRPCRQHRAGQRAGIRAAAARQRHRQFHQDRPAHPREDQPRSGRGQRAAACRHVGGGGDRHQGDGGGQSTKRQCQVRCGIFAP